MKEVEYEAKYNQVWKNIKTGKVCGRKIKLQKGEKLSHFRQILNPKKEKFCTETNDTSTQTEQGGKK